MKTDDVLLIKVLFAGLFGSIGAMLGNLAIPCLLLLLANIIDYATGLLCSVYNGVKISSYRSIKGIAKKVAMWLLVMVGAMLDQMLIYCSSVAKPIFDGFGINIHMDWFVACVVCLWLICNEMISILENLKDMDTKIPAFLVPLINKIQSKVEDTAEETNGKD